MHVVGILHIDLLSKGATRRRWEGCGGSRRKSEQVEREKGEGYGGGGQ